MRVSLDIQEGKADAFLNFIKTLDFVSVAEDILLSEQQKQELDHRLKTAKEEDFISLEEANKMLATKYGL
jgi:predicted nucleic acid-binding protein